MEYHIFNIDEPYTNTWWHELRTRSVITAGFYSEPGDRGDEILHDMAEGDWLIAYCNRRGYVGAGVVKPIETYVLHEEGVLGSQSSNRHERGVIWLHAVDDVAHAVLLSELRIPRHPATQSTLIWPGIPRPSGHLFHGHPAGQSERSDAGVALLV